MKITDEIFEKGKSLNGGWSAKQLALLGVRYPLVSGWRKRLIGQDIDDEKVAQFLRMKDMHLGHKTLSRIAQKMSSANNPINRKEPIPFRPIAYTSIEEIENRAAYLIANFTGPDEQGSHTNTCNAATCTYPSCQCM